MEIISLDHLVLTVRNVDSTCHFYETVLGMQKKEFLPGRFSLHFGNQKINLHPLANLPDPNVRHPTPGSADLCFLTRTPLEEVEATLKRNHLSTLGPPVLRTGAYSQIRSIYCYDPDENLIEIANLVSTTERYLPL